MTLALTEPLDSRLSAFGQERARLLVAVRKHAMLFQAQHGSAIRRAQEDPALGPSLDTWAEAVTEHLIRQ